MKGNSTKVWAIDAARRIVQWLPLLALFASSNSAVAAVAKGYDVVPAPKWVVAADTPPAFSNDGLGGSRYLLVDHQIRLDTAQFDYTHYVIELTNESGVDDNAQIKISIDAKREKLHLHAALIRRGDTVIDALLNRTN